MTALDPTDRRPPYLQVATRLRDRIADVEVGHRLPPIAELASEYAVSEGTVKSALGVLRDEGLITTQHGRGSFVRDPDAEPARTDGLADLRATVAALTQRVEALERRTPADS